MSDLPGSNWQSYTDVRINEDEILNDEYWVSKINLYKPSYTIPPVKSNSGKLSTNNESAKSSLSKINFYCPSEIGQTSDFYILQNMSSSESLQEFSDGVPNPIHPRSSLINQVEDSSDDSDDCKSEYSFEVEEIPGTWGTHFLQREPWNDDDRPVVHSKHYDDLHLNETEKSGILTDRIIAACSSYLDRCPETRQYVLTKVNLHEKGLKDISIIMYHHYLQYVDLSHNMLNDLEALGQLPFLMHLNVSHNNLKTLLDFKPPFNLSHVNYSYNLIEEIPNISEYWSIIYLDLSHNSIAKIEGLDQLRYLKHLDLSYNQIVWIENLNNMALETLNLEKNNICYYEQSQRRGFHTLNYIVKIKLSHNCLNTLRMFKGVSNIQSIEMSNNHIADLFELTYLRNLQYLSNLNLTDNPVTNLEDYWDVTLSSLQSIAFLDGTYIEAESKIFAFRKFRTTQSMKAMEKQCMLFFNNQLSNPSITASVVPVDQPPPLIVILVGPPGSKKQFLLKIIQHEYKDTIIRGVSHTTRKRFNDEINGETYHFINSEVFSEMVRNGEFMTVSEILGHCYGFAHSELEKVTDKHKILLTHMDLSSALTLRTKGLKPYLILTIPSSDEIHRSYLREKYCFSLNASELSPRLIQSFYRVSKKTPVRTSLLNMIKESLNECIDEACSQLEESKPSAVSFKSNTALEQLEQEPVFKKKEYVFEESIDYKNKILSNTRTFGILKSCTKSITGPTSVSYLSAHASRSVTFLEDEFLKLNEEISSPVNNFEMDYCSINPEEDLQRCPSCEKLRIQQINDGPMSVFINEIITVRRRMLEFHLANPGIFCDTIFPDDIETSIESLKGIIHQALEKFPASKHIYDYKEDPLFNTMITDRINNLIGALDRSCENISSSCK